jgi:hypothetical protein
VSSRRPLVLVLLVAAASGGVSCGLSVVGTAALPAPSPDVEGGARESGVVEDAGSDGDGASTSSILCGERLVTSCAGCGVGAALCTATRRCVFDCGLECESAAVACVGCRRDAGLASTAALPEGTCEGLSTASCVFRPAYDHCGCAAASECPAANHVCSHSECRSCGEPDTGYEVCRGVASGTTLTCQVFGGLAVCR